MPIKLILRESVEHLGGRGDIVSVAPGYARNYLLPKGLALPATPGNLKMLEHRRKVWAERDLREVEDAQAVADRLSAVELTVAKHAGETGTLYGSVTKADIAELLAAKGYDVDRKKLGQDEPIKAVGSYEIPIKLHARVTATVKLEVTAEEAAD